MERVNKDLANSNETWNDGTKRITAQKKVWVNGKLMVAPAKDNVKISPLMASILTHSKELSNEVDIDVAFQNGVVQDGVKLDLDNN